jgi:hypothetical protein
MWPRESGLPCAPCLLQLVGRWADGKWIAGANRHLLRRWRGILAGFVPGIAETLSLSTGRSRLAVLQSIERAAAPAGVIDALYAIRVLRNARLSPRRAGDAEAHRRGQQRARQLDAITYSCGDRRTDRSHAGNPCTLPRGYPRARNWLCDFGKRSRGLPRQRRLHVLHRENEPSRTCGRLSGTVIPAISLLAVPVALWSQYSSFFREMKLG